MYFWCFSRGVFAIAMCAFLSACGGASTIGSSGESIDGPQTASVGADDIGGVAEQEANIDNADAAVNPEPENPNSESSVDMPEIDTDSVEIIEEEEISPVYANLCFEQETLKQEMLDEINAARSQARFCGEDFYDEVPALTWNDTLEHMAYNHSTDMAENDFFSHDGTGTDIVSRADDVNYVWASLGENIAAGQRSVGVVMQGWLNSPGHCRNIMSPNYTEVGAICVASDSSMYPTYWTQNFGKQF